MVVKTEVCQYSGFRIYPGHGSRFVRGDGKLFLFANSKCKASFHLKRKAAKRPWTVLYRKLHKKGVQEDVARRRTRRVRTVVTKPVFGATLEFIKARRTQRPEMRKAARDAALKEAKERNKTKKAGKAKAIANQSGKFGGIKAPPPKKH
ncbi:hypothetical protein MMPV_009008 [Pyropia vietnamensis]